MIKVAQLIRHSIETEIDPKDYFRDLDRGAYKMSLKRVGPIKVRSGLNGDDFVMNMISVVLEARATKIPRFMNPIRGRRKGKLKK